MTQNMTQKDAAAPIYPAFHRRSIDDRDGYDLSVPPGGDHDRQK